MIKIKHKIDHKSLTHEQNGLVIVLVIGLISILMVIGISLLSQSTSQYVLTNASATTTNATYTAEAGVEQSVLELNGDSNFSGYPTEQEFFNSENQGRGTYQTTITNASGGSNAKVITSTGRVYQHNSSQKLLSSRTVQVTVVATSSEGYSVMSGPGGLILSGSANIVNSSVYVGGRIELSGAARIGTGIYPLDVNVANKACPSGNNPGSSYPSVCSGTEPIDLAWSTFIFGSVCATGQTSTGPNNNIQPGIGGQGLIAGCTAPDVTQPTYDRQAHIDAVTTSASGNDNVYTCKNWPFTREWPDNLQLTGDVDVKSVCVITLRGDVHITGDLDIGGASTIIVDNALGNTQPTILVDGKITVNGSAQILPNLSGTGPRLISWDSNAPCGSSCTTITGTDLKRTATYETIKVGGAAIVPGVSFQSYWGQATIGGSGVIGSAVGQTVKLNGAGTVTFGTQLSSGADTWTISSYQIKYPSP